MRIIFYSILFIHILAVNVIGAEILFNKNMFGNLITITGNIEKNDISKLIACLKVESKMPSDLTPVPTIRISSKGGDVEESIKIGNFIRNSLLPVV